MAPSNLPVKSVTRSTGTVWSMGPVEFEPIITPLAVA